MKKSILCVILVCAVVFNCIDSFGAIIVPVTTTDFGSLEVGTFPSNWTNSYPTNNDWHIENDGEINVLMYNTPTSGNAFAVTGDTSLSNYRVEAKIMVGVPGANTWNTNGRVGFMGRVKDANNYYIMFIDVSGKIAIAKRVNGVGLTWIAESVVSPALDLTKYHTYAFDMNGSTLTGYINGVQKIQCTDNDLTTGRYGAYSHLQKAYYGDFTLIKIPDSLSVEPTPNYILQSEEVDMGDIIVSGNYNNGTDSADLSDNKYLIWTLQGTNASLNNNIISYAIASGDRVVKTLATFAEVKKEYNIYFMNNLPVIAEAPEFSVFELQEGQINVSTTVNNYDTQSSKEATIVAILYDNSGRQKEILYEQVTLAAGEKNKILSTEISVTQDDVDSHCYIKAYVWDKFDKRVPISWYMTKLHKSGADTENALEIAKTPDTVTIFEPALNQNGDAVRISGTLSSGASRFVTMFVKDPDDNEFYSNQVITGENGYSFNFNMNSNDISGKYTVELNAVNSQESKTIHYYYFSPVEQETVINEINTAVSANDLLGKLNSSHNELVLESIGLNMALFKTLSADSKSSVASKVFSGSVVRQGNTVISKPYNANSLISAFNLATTVSKLNDAANAAELREYVEKNNDVLLLDMSPESLYGKLGTEKQPYMFDNLILKKQFSDIVDLSVKFTNATGIAAVNATSWANMGGILEEYNCILNLTLSGKYTGLSMESKAIVWQALAGKGFVDLDSILTAFNIALSNIQDSSVKSVSDVGSGRGGSTTITNTPQVTPQPIQTSDIIFSDLNSVSWAKDSIMHLAKMGVINGESEGEFNPEGLVTREQFIKMAVLLFDIPINNAKADFSDVNTSDWFYAYVGAAQKVGITSGTGNGAFGTGRNITRQEMAAIVYRCVNILNKKLYNVKIQRSFADEESIDEYAVQAVYAMQMAGVITGIDDNSFYPTQFANRAQAAKILYELWLNVNGGM